MLHTKNQLPMLPRSTRIVMIPGVLWWCGVVVVWWFGCVVVFLPIIIPLHWFCFRLTWVVAICHIMTGNGIRVCTVNESLAALHIQRWHNNDKYSRCTEYTFLYILSKDQIMTCFYTRPMAGAGPVFSCSAQIWILFYGFHWSH